MVDRNTLQLTVDNFKLKSSQAADPKVEKTINTRPPPSPVQKSGLQEINEDHLQTHKIYQFQNCGIVNMDSFNARGVRMENCGNIVPQVTYQLPSIIGNEKVAHLQSHAVGGPQNLTSPPTPTEIVKSNLSNVHLQMDSRALSQPQSPQHISPSHLSGDHIHNNIKHLEQLLDSSLATVSVIQFSGNTLADVLTPRAYDNLKILYALAALDPAASSTNPRGSDTPTPFPSSDIGNDCPYSSIRSSPLPNSSLAVPHTGRIHISISVEYVMDFSWVRFAAVSCVVVFFSLPWLCERIMK